MHRMHGISADLHLWCRRSYIVLPQEMHVVHLPVASNKMQNIAKIHFIKYL